MKYYEDEHVTLYLGDCLTEHREWLDADVLVTDPPYGIGWSKGEDKRNQSRAHAGIQNDMDTTARDNALKAWGARPGVVFGSLYAPAPAPLRHVAVWEKPLDAGLFGSTTAMRRDIEAVYLTGEWPKTKAVRGSVLRSQIPNVGSPNSPAGKWGHPHAKPTDLLEELVMLCPPGVIADPFAGSGATLIAARNLGRKAIGVELEEKYCEIIARRLQQGAFDFGAIA